MEYEGDSCLGYDGHIKQMVTETPGTTLIKIDPALICVTWPSWGRREHIAASTALA